MQKNILETRELSKVYREQKAVNAVSIQVRENTVYGLLGANGAGKSTLLKMIAGIVRPTQGSILVDGEVWSRKSLNKIGSLIESPAIYGNLSARENLKVRTRMLGLPKERIDEVLETVGLTQTGKKRAGKFSMGMKQRLGLAIALLNHPKLLILDEPTNGLDPIGIQDLRQMIQEFPQKGITVIVSSHILSEVSQVADDIGIIADGVLGYQGEMPHEEKLESLFMEIAGAGKIGRASCRERVFRAV